MPAHLIRRYRMLICVVSVLALAPGAASAQWPERLSRLPESPNAVAVFNVTQLRVLKRKLEGGGGAQAAKLIDEVGADIAPDVMHLAICAAIDLNTLEPRWELSLAGASKVPSAEEIAKLEGGYVDRIGERDAVWSPRQAYMIPLPSNRLGVIRPANRQLLVRWEKMLREERTEGLTPYLQQAVGYANDDVPIVMALELEGAVSPIQARQRLAGLEAVQKEQANADALADLFGSLRGVVFSVGRSQDSLRGTMRVDFGASAAPLQKVGKPLVLEVLSNAGMYIDELNLWTSEVQGNSLVLSGPVTTVGLRHMLGFLTTPQIVTSMQETASFSTGSDGIRATSEQMQLKSTQYYFTSTQVAIQQVRNSKARNAGEQGTWNERAARRIDDLPMLHVDPEMLDYGQQVSELLRGAALTIRSANMQAGVERAGTPSTAFRATSAWYGPYNSYVSGVNTNNPAVAVIRREASRQGNTAHQENMAKIDELTLAIRRKMTERYRTEF